MPCFYIFFNALKITQHGGFKSLNGSGRVSVNTVMVNMSKDSEDMCRSSFKPLSEIGLIMTIVNVTYIWQYS
jgi:hypothetical protein